MPRSIFIWYDYCRLFLELVSIQAQYIDNPTEAGDVSAQINAHFQLKALIKFGINFSSILRRIDVMNVTGNAIDLIADIGQRRDAWSTMKTG